MRISFFYQNLTKIDYTVIKTKLIPKVNDVNKNKKHNNNDKRKKIDEYV
jgi:hypothetical protein